MGLFLVGLLGGLPVSAVAVRLPYAVERQWLLDASETLDNVRGPNCAGRLGKAWRPDHLSLRVGLTMLGMGLLSGWVALWGRPGCVRGYSPGGGVADLEPD
ncbi:hypothetical protein [Pseudomonas helleri]|nr:hypothetical protein [Pseudomonas helleri]